ncbi:MAG: tetratricopeptide repeat protein [Cyanobacteria bacterium P01_F01_bin.143]
MNSQDPQRTVNTKQGNYIENVKGDYIVQPGDRAWDEITGIPNNLPLFASNNFVGREDELAELNRLLQTRKTVAISAIAGMGGIGKTELAIQYALNYRNQYPGSICWLKAREDVGTQIVNFAISSLNLKMPENCDLATQVQYCWNHWSKDNSLILLDDVPNYGKYYQESIQPYLSSIKQNCKILITSRQKPGTNIEYLDLNVLSSEAALELLRSLSGYERIVCDREAKKDYPSELCQRLGYLPLGIELVGRYLVLHSTDSIAEVIDQLAEKQLAAEALIHPEDADMLGQLGVAEAFELSWQELTTEAQELGCYLGLFGSDPFLWSWVEDSLLAEDLPEKKSIWQRISKNFFGRFLKNDSSEIDSQETRAERINQFKNSRDIYLLRFNLLKINSNQQYQLHSLIQQYFRAKLGTLEQAKILKHKFTEPMIAIAESIPETPIQEDLKKVELAIPHLKNVAAELIDYVKDENLIWVYVGLGRFYEGQGAYNQAEPYRENNVQVCRNRLGEEHPVVAASLNNLATLYNSQGRYDEAKTLYLQSLEIKQRLFGEKHPSVATSLNNLAALYDSQGRYDEAKTLYLQSLEIKQRLFGEDHSDVADSLNNLAYLYYLQGKYDKSEPFYLQALEIRQKLFGDGHPVVANSLNNLAALYDSQGRYDEAKPLYLQALEIRRKLLGDEHPVVATSLNNLAYLYYLQGRYDEAEPLYLQSLELRRKLLGDKHPDVASSLNNLALLYRSQGRYDNAEPLYIQALEIRQKLLGEEHPDIAQSLNNLAELYRSEGRYEEAEPLYLQALEIDRKLLGEEHPEIAIDLNNLAYLYSSQEKYDKAKPIYQQALAIAEKSLETNHPTTKNIRGNLEILSSNL